MISIYALYDSRFPTDLRYVGKTKQRLSRRLYGHRNPRDDTYVSRWERKVIADGGSIEMLLLGSVEVHEWQSAERFAIAALRLLGYSLTNTADGGQGSSGFKMSEDAKKRISSARKGKPKSPQHRAAISASQKGRKASDQARANQSAAQKGKKKPRTSEAMRGRAITWDCNPRKSMETMRQRGKSHFRVLAFQTNCAIRRGVACRWPRDQASTPA